MSEPETDTGGVREAGMGYCIRPVAAVPPTILVAELGDGSLLLHNRRAGPSAHVCAVDAGPLREALAAAFGSEKPSAYRFTATQAQP